MQIATDIGPQHTTRSKSRKKVPLQQTEPQTNKSTGVYDITFVDIPPSECVDIPSIPDASIHHLSVHVGASAGVTQEEGQHRYFLPLPHHFAVLAS